MPFWLIPERHFSFLNFPFYLIPFTKPLLKLPVYSVYSYIIYNIKYLLKNTCFIYYIVLYL